MPSSPPRALTGPEEGGLTHPCSGALADMRAGRCGTRHTQLVTLGVSHLVAGVGPIVDNLGTRVEPAIGAAGVCQRVEPIAERRSGWCPHGADAVPLLGHRR